MSSVILIVGLARRTKRGRGTFPLPHKFNLRPYADGPSESAAPQGRRGVLWPSRPACSRGACLCRTSRRRGLSVCPGSARWGPRDPGHGHRPRDGGPPSECLCARTALAPPCSCVRFPDKAVSSATAIATPGRQRRDVTCPTHGPARVLAVVPLVASSARGQQRALRHLAFLRLGQCFGLRFSRPWFLENTGQLFCRCPSTWLSASS